MIDPDARTIHDLPLANRLVDDLIAAYVAEAVRDAYRMAQGWDDQYVGVAEQTIDAMERDQFGGWELRLTPKILDALRRAGLLVDREPAP